MNARNWQAAQWSATSLKQPASSPPELSIPEPAGKGDVNPSLSMDVLEFKRRINPTLKSRFEAEVTGEMLSRISAEMGGGKGRLLEPALRRSILGECAAGNREIARRYLGREDGELFREPWPDPDEAWEPYPRLSSQTEAEIARRLQQRRRSLAGRAFILRKRASAVLQDQSHGRMCWRDRSAKPSRGADHAIQTRRTPLLKTETHRRPARTQ